MKNKEVNKSKSHKSRNGTIRILQYIGSLDIGGSQAMMMNIYRKIDRKKIQFDFIIDKKNETHFADEIKTLGGKVYIFDESFKGYNYVSYVNLWRRFFCEHPEYKIIHCHVRSVASIVLKEAKKSGLKTISHSHSISNGGGLEAVVKKILQKGIGKYSDYMMACSRAAAVWLFGEQNAASDRCVIINNAVDPDKYRFDPKIRDRIRKEYKIMNDELLVGHVGRFVDVKNHSFMLNLADKMRGKKVKFIFCGDGDNKKEISEIAKTNKQIIFYDEITEANELYSAMDVFILPSKYEGLGMVLIEAQFNGLPCVASVTVPRDVIISKDITFLPLELNKWRDALLEIKPKATREPKLLPNANNYVVTDTIKRIMKVYLDLSNAMIEEDYRGK